MTSARSKSPASVAVPGDGDLPELAAGGRAADLDVERAGGGLRVVAGDGQRAAGADRQAAAVGEIAGGGEAGPVGQAEVPLFAARPAMPAIVAPAPPRATLAALLVMFVPLGELQRRAVEAFQVPPVSVLPETWLNGVGSR